MRPSVRAININACVKRAEVDNRISLHYYYRIVDNLLKQKLLDVMNELESPKPAVQRQVDEFNTGHFQSDALERISSGTTPAKKQIFPSSCNEQAPIRSTSQLSWKPSNEWNHIVALDHMYTERQYHRLSLSLPQPKEEALSWHSILGPNGLWSQWTGPVTGIRVHYPSITESIQSGITGMSNMVPVWYMKVTLERVVMIWSLFSPLMTVNGLFQ